MSITHIYFSHCLEQTFNIMNFFYDHNTESVLLIISVYDRTLLHFFHVWFTHDTRNEMANVFFFELPFL